jgi:hypothetical protein
MSTHGSGRIEIHSGDKSPALQRCRSRWRGKVNPRIRRIEIQSGTKLPLSSGW